MKNDNRRDEEQDDVFREFSPKEAPMYDNPPPVSAGSGAESAEAKPTVSRKSHRIWLAVVSVAVAVVFFLVGWFSHYYSIDSRARTLLWMLDTLDKRYYKDIDFDELYNELYNDVVPDQFSAFYSAEEYSEILSESQGQSDNVGFSVYLGEEHMRVALVVGNSSADVAGIRCGMYIYRFGADAESLQEGGFDDVREFLGRHTGPFVLECGFKDGEKALYTVESNEYLASYCSYADSEGSYAFRDDGSGGLELKRIGDGFAGLDGDTGYLRMIQFEGNAASEFETILAFMNARGRQNLVIDLRRNGGGYLSILQSISAHLMRECNESAPVVAKATYRSGKQIVYKANGNDFTKYFSPDSKISVLADENSASASECLLGVLVDYGTVDYADIYVRQQDDGTVRTYGKGVMQSTYATAKGEAFRLTVAEICWPNGKSIHGVGVTEKDGATPIAAPMLPDSEDVFLTQVFAQL